MENEIKKESVTDDKTLDTNASTAPVKDETIEQSPETTDTLDAEDVDQVVMLLNIMDQEIGGKGEISKIPEEIRGSVGYLVDQLTFVRDLFSDPLWKSILDDMADQKEDGKTPSVEVAIARNIPLEKIQSITEGEDYEGVQNELSESLSAKKKTEEEDAGYEASFEATQKAGEEYAAEMGYDEDEKSKLFQQVLDLLKITADGKLTVEEFRQVDKMRNYDKDTEDLRSQIQSNDAKEVLPDKASVDAAAMKTQPKQKSNPSNGPGLSSMNAYNNVATDITQIGKRNRK